MNTLQISYKFYNLTLNVSSIAAVVSTVRDDGGRPLPAVRSVLIELRRSAHLSQKVVQCLSFQQFLLGNSVTSLRAEIAYISAGFDQNFIVRPQQIPFHYIVIARMI